MIDFSNPAHMYGLDREDARLVHEMVHAYDERLSFRRVPEADPAFDPEKPWGVYEEGVRASREFLSPWVFFVGDSGIDHRVMARVYESDMVRQGVSVKIAKQDALRRANAEANQKAREEFLNRNAEEAVSLAKLLNRKTAVRHDFGDGDGRVIIGGDGVRSGRTFII